MFFFFSLFVQTYFSAKQISNMRTWSTTKVKPSPLLVSLHSECIYLLFFSPFSLPWPDSEMDISSLTPQWISFVSSIELSSVLERERGEGGTSTIGFGCRPRGCESNRSGDAMAAGVATHGGHLHHCQVEGLSAGWIGLGFVVGHFSRWMDLDNWHG